jgi:RNA-directed DNA polymerase
MQSALIACPGTLWFLETILAHGTEARPTLDPFPGDTLLTPLERPHGLPIGNLTSQFLANLHLNDFDHEIASMTGVASYLRSSDRIRVRNHTLSRGRRRLRAVAAAVAACRLAPEQARQRLISWNAHLRHGNTWRLRRPPFANDIP